MTRKTRRMGIASLGPFRLVLGGIFFLVAATAWGNGFDFDHGLIKGWLPHDGKTIRHLTFKGQERTREQALRWLVDSREGTTFSSVRLAKDLQTLYNTGNLYDLCATPTAVSNDPQGVDVEISFKDKWTLLPIFGAQGGGGALTYGGGLYDTNVAGFLINGQLLGYNYNGIFSYDVNFNQEYIAGSQILGSIDWSNNVNPTIIHNIDGSSAGEFTWQRQQEEIILGTHLDVSRVMIIADVFTDVLVSNKGVNASVYSGSQYRLRPKAVLGKVNLTNFLEEGTEITLEGSASNFLGPAPNYQDFQLGFKKVKIVNQRDNVGFFLGGGIMTFAPPPYQYQVGGYVNLRGFIDSRQMGPYLLHGNLEYRPLLYVNRWSFFDVDQVAFQGCLFVDGGSAWGDSSLTGDFGSRQMNWLWSVGAGLRINFVKFAGAILRLDVARTVRPDEGWGMSFGVGQFF